MAKECAVEPEVMGASYDRFANLLDRFGLHQGRVISEFPEDWCRRVEVACAGLRPMEKHRITERLVQARGTRVLKFRRPYSERIGDWMANAIHQHQNNRRFHAIVGSRTAPGVSECILPTDVDDAHPLFAPSSGGVCARGPSELADLLVPYLAHSREILFVDPFFNPAIARWKRPLKSILAAAVTGGRVLTRVEYHYVEHRDTLSLGDIERNAWNLFNDILPPGLEIKLHCWRQRERGEEFHARYVLTEKVGMSIDAGLSTGDQGETTDWRLLTPSAHAQRWAAFQAGAGVYELVGTSLTVNAQGKCTRG